MLRALVAREFPSAPRRFWAYAVLTDGMGTIPFSLQIIQLDTLDEIYVRTWQSTFTNPLRKFRMPIRIESCSFPAPGRYEISLVADDEVVAQTVLTVASGENEE
jgi:hypothetical protein